MLTRLRQAQLRGFRAFRDRSRFALDDALGFEDAPRMPNQAALGFLGGTSTRENHGSRGSPCFRPAVSSAPGQSGIRSTWSSMPFCQCVATRY